MPNGYDPDPNRGEQTPLFRAIFTAIQMIHAVGCYFVLGSILTAFVYFIYLVIRGLARGGS